MATYKPKKMLTATAPSPLARLPRYTRADRYPPLQLGRPHCLLLGALGRFHYLSAPQLTRLLYSPGSLTYVQEHLKRLFHAHYVERVYLPTITPHGSSLAVYTLASEGIAYLKRAGLAPEGRFRPSEQAHREWLFLRHTLEANELLISAHRLARAHAEITVAQMKCERELKHAPVYVQAGKERIGVVPDGWIDVRFDDLQACVAFELDRDTVEREAFRRKVRGLLAYADGPYAAAFGTSSLTIAVVTTAGERRMTELLTWTQHEFIERDAREQADLFRFAAFDPAATDPHAIFFAPLWRRPFDPAPLPLLNVDPSTLGRSHA